MQYELLGKYIRTKRMGRKITLNRFSFDNGIDPAILCRIENLKQSINLNILIKIAKGFGKTPAEFLADFESEE